MKTISAFRCKQCGQVMYPRHLRCLNCKGRDFEEIQPQGEATLVTYTVVNELPWGIDERGRILGVVEFENGVKVLGLIHAEAVQIGMKLKAGWGPVRVIAGEKTYGMTFQPAG